MRATLVRHGLEPRGAGRAAARPATAGSRCRRWSTRPSSSPRADGADLGGFVDDLDRRAAEQHAPVADGVTLATLHAAKGLEWDSVFLAGLQEGTLPFSYAESPAEVEEERRLLYVGMTRARLDLALSWSLARNPGGRATRKPSRFLDGLLPEEQRGARRSPAARAVGQLPRVRQAAGDRRARRSAAGAPAARRPTTRSCSSGCASGGAPPPSEESVPAFVVFTDATLQLIAEHKPRTPEALLRVNGIGRAKLERYGEAVLTLIAERVA